MPITLTRAFTLMELLACIVVGGILLILGLTSIKSISTRSGNVKCAGNLRQIGVATAAYLVENNGWLPVAYETYLSDSGTLQGTWGDSKSKTGAWYWNVAPYLDIPRSASNGVWLGEPGSQGISSPIIFTCPRHGDAEPVPISYPSRVPVSYAPTIGMRTRDPVSQNEGRNTYRINIKQHPAALQKVWIMDSPEPSVANVNAARWNQGGSIYRVSQRHSMSCNALFLDGRIESIPVSEITAGDVELNIKRRFILNSEEE